MKQKVVIKVQMNSEKCRTKALKTVINAEGLDTVAIGADKSKLVAIGDGIDPISLVTSLRKKIGHATILSVGSVQIREVSITGKKPEENEDNPTPSYCPVQGCK